MYNNIIHNPYHFPIQKSLKITSSICSVLTWPVILPICLRALRSCWAARTVSPPVEENLKYSSRHVTQSVRWRRYRDWVRQGFSRDGFPHLQKQQTSVEYTTAYTYVLRLQLSPAFIVVTLTFFRDKTQKYQTMDTDNKHIWEKSVLSTKNSPRWQNVWGLHYSAMLHSIRLVASRQNIGLILKMSWNIGNQLPT